MIDQIDLDRDLQTIQNIKGSVLELINKANQLSHELDVREKGYFLPDEDNSAKRLFLSFRSHRIALMEIINHYDDCDYENILKSKQDAKAFLLGLSSALLLYNWSSFLIHSYKDVAPVRAKLNEADKSFGLEGGLFDEIYRNLTRVETQHRLMDAISSYETIRDELIQKIPTDSNFFELIEHVDYLSQFVQKGTWNIWTTRLQRDLDIVPKRLTKPIKFVGFKLKSWFCDFTGNIWLDQIPQIPEAHRKKFENLMQPGDFFIVRPEQKSSTLLLPGWWTHAAVYFGGYDKLMKINALDLPNLIPNIDTMKKQGTGNSVVLEALSAGVVMNPLTRTLNVDHAVAFRPQLNEEELLEALNDLFSHYGKAYDFEFDLSRSDKLVCTEVLYRTLHGKGEINFKPNKRYGRLTISADDIVQQIVKRLIEGTSKIDVLAISTKDMSTGKSEFLEGDSAVQKLISTIKVNA